MNNELKNLLGEIADEAPQYPVTEVAVRSGLRRQRITRLAPVAAMVAVILAAVGVWLPLHRTAPNAADAGTGADVIVGNELYTADGRRIALPAVDAASSAVRWAYRLPGGGWLVSRTMQSQTGESSEVLRIDADGTSHVVLSAVRGPVYDPASQRLVWVTLHSKTLIDGRLSGTTVTDRLAVRDPRVDAGRGGLLPGLFSGTDWVVLTELTVRTYRSDRGDTAFTVWHPGSGEIRKVTAVRPIEVILGTTADGSLVGVYDVAVTARGGKPCLSALDGPNQRFAPRGRAVCSDLMHDRDGLIASWGFVSPGGLALITQYAGGIIHAFQVGADTSRPTSSWKLGTGTVGSLAWLGAHTAVLAFQRYSAQRSHSRLYRIDTDRPGVAKRLPLPDGASGPALVVTPPA